MGKRFFLKEKISAEITTNLHSLANAVSAVNTITILSRFSESADTTPASTTGKKDPWLTSHTKKNKNMTSIKRREFLHKSVLLTSAIVVNSVIGSNAQSNQYSELDNKIEQFLQNSSNFAVGGIELRHLNKLREIYSERKYAPLWSINGTVTSTSIEITKRMLASNLIGLDPAKYYGRLLFQFSANPGSDHLKYELLLTDSLYTYFDDLAHGALEQPAPNKGWRLPKSNLDISDISKQFFNGEISFRQAVDQLQPSHARYKGLLQALKSHKWMQSTGGWPTIPTGKTLQIGDKDPRVAILTERLMSSGDLQYGNYRAINEFDTHIELALVNFQTRHGLEADGVLGPKTLIEMNVPISDRIAQLETNIERWRWLPRDLGYSNIIVNTAGYDMEFTANGTLKTAMKVVVGTQKNKTPLFSDSIKHMVFNPSWYVPKSIVRELHPKAMANPGWFEKNNFEVSSRSSGAIVSSQNISGDTEYFAANYLVRQRPGNNNALGRIKFMFPNKYSIYLHDTNAKSLFDHSQRAFSHGCVRLEKPFELAKALLGSDGRTNAEIDSNLLASNTRKVPLRTPLPIHLTYQTAWVDYTGITHFRNDIYQHDKDTIKQIKHNRPLYAEAEMRALSATGLTVVSANTY